MLYNNNFFYSKNISPGNQEAEIKFKKDQMLRLETDVELIAIATGARIILRFQEITSANLGKAGFIKEVQFRTSNERMLVIEIFNAQKKLLFQLEEGIR